MRRRGHSTGRFLRHRRPRGAPLPGDRFGMLVGEFSHQTLSPQGKTNADDNHVYLWVRVPDRPGWPGGVYECAFNIHSRGGSEVMFAELEEEIGDDLPPFGFHPEPLAYRDFGLADEDFTLTRHGDLHILVAQYTEMCDRIAAYGTTYDDGTGLHDIHLCTERRGSRRAHLHREGQDGALVFYFAPGKACPDFPCARWIFVKFATQTLHRE